MNTRNLDAYYYSFEPTGCGEVDAILEQVAQAGAGYHSTADWQDKYADGSSPTSNMQRAAEESAAQINIIIAERDQLKAENEALKKSTGAAMFLTLTGELAAFRKKLTTVHFVCDRLPDQDGCRFIELESPQGESLGDESGKWEIRPDGLAQLVVDIASPDVKHMAALLECAQGDLKQAMQIIEKLTPQADLYQQVQIAAGSMPSGWEIALRVESGCGCVDLIDPYGKVVDLDNVDESLSESVASAVAFAMSEEG